MVLRCAPLIVGVKISNLFVTEPGSIRSLKRILDGSGISFYVLTGTPEKSTCFLFRKSSMEFETGIIFSLASPITSASESRRRRWKK